MILLFPLTFFFLFQAVVELVQAIEYANHDYNATMHYSEDDRKKAILVTAERDIAEGEEVDLVFFFPPPSYSYICIAYDLIWSAHIGGVPAVLRFHSNSEPLRLLRASL